MATMVKKNANPVERLMMAVGGLFGLWALTTLVAGLHQVNWQVTELMRQYLIATGLIQPLYTLVDFYSHIKGVEYIICVLFFVAFPLFFQYLEKNRHHITASAGTSKKR
jgi:hypothetical protein